MLTIDEFSNALDGHLQSSYGESLKGKDFNFGCIWDTDFESLAKYVQKSEAFDGPIIEIGSLFGYNLVKMAGLLTKPKKLIGVDNFCWSPVGISPDQGEETLLAMVNTFCPHADIELIRMDKNQFYLQSSHKPAMIFIDANHSYVETVRDLKWARSTGAPIICGDDYCDSYPGLMQAVDESGRLEEQVGAFWALDTVES